jgi:tetratricopeptide (TPR) repeat protein
MRIALAAWTCLLLGAGCRSAYGSIERSNAREHLDRVEAVVRAGDYAEALAHLEAVHDVSGLEPDLRAREERLTDEAAEGRFAELAEDDGEALEELFSSKLPERIRARAGVLAAERMLENDRRVAAYRMVKEVDTELPGHHERVLAGEVLARSGLSLIADDRRYNLLFRYRSRGIQVLEYLVVRYPLEPRCAEAFYALSQTYERQGNFDEAIARTEDLLLYHPASLYAPAASARLPYLRLARLPRDDFDRGELLRAHAELGAWLARYAGHELAPWVGELHFECTSRLVRSDLYLAGYYSKTDVPAGQRLHAERALSLAREAGLQREVEEAEGLLASLAPAPALDPGAER